MKRRGLRLVFVISLVLLSAAVAGGAAKQKLVYWAEKSFVEDFNLTTQKLADEFAKQNDCEVEVVFLAGADIAVKMVAAITAKTVPDMAMVSSMSVTDAYEMDALADVSPLYKELDGKLGGFFEGAKNEATFSGKQYAIPFAYTSNVYFERRDIAKQIGVEVKTWDDMFDVGKKIKAAGIKMDAVGFGISRCPDSATIFYPVMWSCGGSITQADGKTIAITSPGVQKAVQYYVDWYKAGYMPADTLSWDNNGNNKAYQSGTAFNICNTDSVYQWMKANDQKLLANSYIGKWPSGPAGRFGQGGTYTLTIYKGAQNPDLAAKFIRFLMKDENYLALRRLWMLPVYRKLAEQPPWNTSYEKEMFASLEYAQPLSYPAAPSLAANRIRNAFVVMDVVLKVIIDSWTVQRAVEYGVDLVKQYLTSK